MEYKQISEPESQEANINIDYFDRKIRIYINKATVMNRMTRAGYLPVKIEAINGEICSLLYEFDFNDFPRIISSGMFKCD